MLHKQDEFVLSSPLHEGPRFGSWHVSLHVHLDASLTTFFWAFVTSHIPPFTPLPFLFNARVAFPTWSVRFLFLPLGLMAWFRPLIIQRRNAPAGSVYTNLHIYMRAWWRLVLQHVHSVPHWLGVKSKLNSSVCTGSYIRIILCIWTFKCLPDFSLKGWILPCWQTCSHQNIIVSVVGEPSGSKFQLWFTSQISCSQLWPNCQK